MFLILQKFGKTWAKGLYHLSYGMVDLPSGKMKSREGTVVDADDLITEMEQTAKEQTEALGKVTEYSDEDYDTVGGLVVSRFGRLPKRGERITIDQFNFKVVNADSRRLHSLLVEKIAPQE